MVETCFPCPLACQTDLARKGTPIQTNSYGPSGPAKSVWALEQEEAEFLCSIYETNARYWLAAIVNYLSEEEAWRVAVTLWAIWHAKRKAIHENSFQSLMKVPVARWIPPPEGIMKINVDAALAKNTSQASVAAVARDATGIFLGASVVVLEVLACREDLALASDLQKE